MKTKGDISIIGLIRAKNAADYLPDLLGQMKVFCREILLLDDNSEDDTVEVAREIGARVQLNTGILDAHEGRDRRRLHRWAAEFNPDWIFAPDTGELLEDGGPEKIRGIVFGAESVGIEAFQFPLLYLWGDDKHYRVDGIYKDIAVVRLFRYCPNLLPLDREAYSMAVPVELLQRGKFCRSEIRMVHYGHMTPLQRIKKYEWNMKHYPIGSQGYEWAGGKGYDHILGRDAEIEEI